jgi:HSP20 family protein
VGAAVFPLGFAGSPARFGCGSLTWALTMDVYENDNSIYVKAELPGLKKEDVTVEVDGDERAFGSFFRRMQLPAGVTAAQIEANLKDGVLEVRIPKATAAKSEATKVRVK